MIDKQTFLIKMKQETNLSLTEILNSNLSYTTKLEIFEWLHATNRINAKTYQDLVNILTDIKDK